MKAIIFAGQGSQVEAMGKDFYQSYQVSKDYYDSLGDDLKNLILNENIETLSRTANTQPALIAYQTMIINLFRQENIHFDYTGGLSIGEYAALVQAGVLEDKDAVQIAKIRGRLMEEVEDQIDSKMLALIGGDKDQIEDMAKSVSDHKSFVQISNINSPNQIVVSGHRLAVDRLKEKIAPHTRKIVELNTSGPFHTPYMDQVADDLLDLFEKYDFKEEKTPIVYNYTGQKRQENQTIQEIMARQVSSPVLFDQVLRAMVDEGVKTFVEVGYGSVIKGLVRRIDRKLEVVEINSVENFENYISEVKNG